MGKRILLGFIAAIVLGGGAGAAIGPVAQKMAPVRVDAGRPPAIDLGRVVVEAVEGEVQMLDHAGKWIAVAASSRVSRPVRLRTVGADAEVTLAFRGVRLVAAHEADLLLSAPGPEPAVIVTTGHVRLHRGAKDISLFVPSREVKLIGQTFGVWVRERDVAVSVLDGELEVQAPGRKPIKFARGRELLIDPRRVVPAVLDKQLEIQVQGTSRRGYRYTLTGRTAPHALVLHTDDDKASKAVRVSPAGVFSVDLLDRRPQPGQVVAYDSAGRRAEVDEPSRTLDEVVEALTGTAKAAEAAANGDAPAAGDTAATEPAKAPPPEAAKVEPPPPAAPPPPAKAPPVEAAKAPPPKAPPPAKAPPPTKPTSERGKSTPEPVKLELGSGTLKSPGLEKVEVDPGRPKPKLEPKPAAKPKPKPEPEPTGDEEAL